MTYFSLAAYFNKSLLKDYRVSCDLLVAPAGTGRLKHRPASVLDGSTAQVQTLTDLDRHNRHILATDGTTPAPTGPDSKILFPYQH